MKRAIGASALALLLAAAHGCSSDLSTCKPTSRSAGTTILTAWCQRYVECDATRGTVDACVATRLGVGQVPNEDGCAGTCSEDVDCHRSTCSRDRIDACKQDSLAMKCEDQVNGPLVEFPSGCDTCFSN